jgi:hypothetical protein
MAIHRLTPLCEDKITCPGVWRDDQCPGEMIVVGEEVDPALVPLGPGERAVRISVRIVSDALPGV